MSVRWDAVVDRSGIGIFDVPPPRRTRGPDVGPIEAHVRLFGVLASVCAERSINLSLPAGATIADLLSALCERLGDDFRARVLDANGTKHRYCRLFVDGAPADSLAAPLGATTQLSEIEIILLIAPEGG